MCEFAQSMKLSLAEAATRLGKSERQVRFLIQKGQLRAAKVEGRWVLDADDLPAAPAAERAAEVRAEVARETLERAVTPATRGKAFSVTDLLAYRTGVTSGTQLLREAMFCPGVSVRVRHFGRPGAPPLDPVRSSPRGQ